MCSFNDLVDDGAPMGSCDPEYARGFRYGQEYGIKIEHERIMALLDSFEKSCANGDCYCLSAGSTIKLIKGQKHE